MEIFFCFVSSAAPQAVLEAAPIGDNYLFPLYATKEFFSSASFLAFDCKLNMEFFSYSLQF
jgi:hypothetical protein